MEVLVLEGLVGLHRTVQLQLLLLYWWGIDLDCFDTEWFSGFPYFLQSESEFGNKGFMI